MEVQGDYGNISILYARTNNRNNQINDFKANNTLPHTAPVQYKLKSQLIERPPG